MVKELTIIQLGNPALRVRSQPVTPVNDPPVQQLIDDLLAQTQASNGVGLAAPQIGIHQRIVIVASRPNPRYPDAPLMTPMAMVNPQILAHSEEQVSGWEGCLSVPGIRGWVPRYREIEVAYEDRQGQPQQQIFTDFVARIIQHELDHLEGKVFLDRVPSTLDLMTEQEYQSRVVGNSKIGAKM